MINLQTIKNEDDDGSNSGSGSSRHESEDGDVSPDSRDEADRGRQRAETTPSNKKRTRSGPSARRSEERKKSQEFAEKHKRKKEVKLNKLTSISGRGSQQSFQKPSFTCHSCGKPGHKAAECSKKRQ
jgi:hypothetical protein